MRIKNKKNKKALSTIIATLLIILLVLVATGIVWASVSKVIQEGKEQIELGKITLDLELRKVVGINESFVRANVKRHQGKGELVGLSFVFFNGEESEVINRDLSIDELEEEILILALGEVQVTEIKKVSIAPILELGSGKRVVGPIKDEFKIEGNLICESTCESLGTQCGTLIFCGVRTNCGACDSGWHCPNTTCMQNTYPWELGLVSWWNFNGDSNDTRGNNPGVVYGATLNSNGKSGGLPCYYFDGIDDYIDVGQFSIQGNEMTLAAWVRTDAATWGTDPTIIAKSSGPQLDDTTFLMGLNDTTLTRARFMFQITSDETFENYNDGTYNINAGWHFLVNIYNSTHMIIYFDNSLVGIVPKTGNLDENDASVNIGRNPTSTTEAFDYWRGYIDEPMIWDRAITDSEVNDIYNLFL